MYSVYSWPEMWTTAFGWQVYGAIFDVIVATGIIYIPFLIVTVSHVSSSIKKGGMDGGIYSFRAIVSDNIAMFAFLLIFVYPFKGVDMVNFKVVPLVSEQSSNNNSSGSQSMTDNLSSNNAGGQIFIPYFYHWLNQVLHGSALAVTARLDSGIDFRRMEALFQAAVIEDPVLFKEVSRFTSECFSPASAKYNRVYGASPTNLMKDVLSDDAYDTTWIGSKIFMRTKGLYAQCSSSEMQSATCASGDGFKAIKHVDNVSFDADYGDYREDVTGREVVRPYCADWWQGRMNDSQDDGIIGRLVDYSESLYVNDDSRNLTINELIKEEIGTAFGVDLINQDIDIQNVIIRKMLSTTAKKASTAPTLALDDGSSSLLSSTSSWLKNMFGTVAAVKENLFTSVKIQVVRNNLNLALSFAIFGVLVVLPFLSLFSGFSFSSLIVPIVAFVVMKITPFFWHVVDILDNKLIEVMGLGWGDGFSDVLGSGSSFSAVSNQDFVTVQNVAIVELIIMSLYIGLPLIFTMLINTVARGANSVGGANGEPRKNIDNVGAKSEQQASATASKAQGGLKNSGK